MISKLLMSGLIYQQALDKLIDSVFDRDKFCLISDEGKDFVSRVAISLEGWSPETFLFISVRHVDFCSKPNIFIMHRTKFGIGPWIPSVYDILRTTWRVYEVDKYL